MPSRPGHPGKRWTGRAFPGLSGRWQHCAANASSPAPAPLFVFLPRSCAQQRGWGIRACQVHEMPNHLHMVCAWQVTTGLNPQHGADSDLGVFVAPGVTVALDNWFSLLDFNFFPLHQREGQGRTIAPIQMTSSPGSFLCGERRLRRSPARPA